MKKTILIIVSMMIFSAAAGIFFIKNAQASDDKLYVGSGQTYTSIQEAIGNASTGDAVYVYSGNYYENIEINKSITLEGQDMNTTVIYGIKKDNVIHISADNVTIFGFNIQNSEQWNAGIILDAVENCRIDSNNLNDNWDGISLDSSKNNTIINNLLIDNKRGIKLGNSKNNTIIINNIYDNEYQGIDLASSSSNTITENNIYNTGLYGTGYGINLWNSSSNTILNNNIHDNSEKGVRLWSNSNNNIIYKNDFTDNGCNAYDENHNTWYNPNSKEGNYWDDYTGFDNTNDSIGDTPYNITGGNNQDLYPIIKETQTINNDGTENNLFTDDNKNKNQNTGIPGFEILLLICATALFVFLKRKKLLKK